VQLNCADLDFSMDGLTNKSLSYPTLLGSIKRPAGIGLVINKHFGKALF
jgi:hypothetical protein